MDFNVENYRTRSGRTAKRLVIIPDADISDAANDSQSDGEEKQYWMKNDSETDDSDEEIPLLPKFPKPTQPSTSVTSVGPKKMNWVKRVPKKHFDTQWKGRISEPPCPMTPIDYFRQFFPNDLFQLIQTQTNLYALQNQSTFRTNTMEIEQFVGILLKMGIVGMPQRRMYWSKAMRFPPIADVMSRDRFELMCKYLHFNDNNDVVKERESARYDSYFKIRPVLDALRTCCLKVEPEEHMSIDEQMIPFKGI
jgi:hypothetical protein